MQSENIIIYRQSISGQHRMYVRKVDENYRPVWTDNPAEIGHFPRSYLRKIEHQTPYHLYDQIWTPALQEELQSNKPANVIHYSMFYIGSGVWETAHTACNDTVHRDSVTDEHEKVTCPACLRWFKIRGI